MPLIHHSSHEGSRVRMDTMDTKSSRLGFEIAEATRRRDRVTLIVTLDRYVSKLRSSDSGP